MMMPELTPQRAVALSSFINECHGVANMSDFRARVHPRLTDILPHAMFACGMVRMADLRILESMNLTFPSGYLKGLVNEEKHTTCPAIRKWVELRSPVFIDGESAALQPQDRTWLKEFERYGIGNVATHGVMNLNQECACYFAFGGIDGWSKWEVFMLQLLVPHLHYALTHVEDFGNKRPRKILTQREQEVLKWIGAGKSNADIAGILGISSWTVKIHVGNVLMKLNASNRGHAVAKAISFGLIEV